MGVCCTPLATQWCLLGGRRDRIKPYKNLVYWSWSVREDILDAQRWQWLTSGTQLNTVWAQLFLLCSFAFFSFFFSKINFYKGSWKCVAHFESGPTKFAIKESCLQATRAALNVWAGLFCSQMSHLAFMPPCHSIMFPGSQHPPKHPLGPKDELIRNQGQRWRSLSAVKSHFKR